MSHGSKFETHVQDAVGELELHGYKVKLQEIHGHYRGSDGETYNQRGYAIRVYPYKDWELKPMKTCHKCRTQVPHEHKGSCPSCGASEENIYV